ncbi:MAG: SH3 domain-containing protein [Pseudomonadota bacterium]
MIGLGNNRRLRVAVSALALMGVTAQPVLAQKKDSVLNACEAQRAPLVKLDKEYDDLKRSKMSQAIGEGLKTGAMVLAKGVASGNIRLPGSGGGYGGGFGGMGGMGSLMGAVGGMAMQSAAQQQAGGPAPASPAGMLFGPDMLSGASGLYVPGVSSYGGFSAGGDGKAYAALAVLVAIVATADAYAKLKEQEAGGDLKKASFNIDQDASRQLAVTREIVDSGNALVECRATQLNDINTRLAGATNDKDRKAIRRERTELVGALKKDIDVTGGVVDQHTNMAKTFTQGRAMTDGSSEADVLGGQTPAYATAAATTRVSMPKGAAPAGGQAQQASAPAAAPPPALVAVRAAALRSGPAASAPLVKNLPVGTSIQAKAGQADGGWWEVEVGGETGYVRAAEVGPPGSAPAAPVQTAAAGGKGKGKAAAAPKAPPPPPAVQGPTNIRAYNQSVIAARDNGKGRLGALMTDIQAAQLKENRFYAMLTTWRWG